jgi:hypothetical protein
VVITGFAGALVALGNLAASDFIAIVAPLGALIAVLMLVIARTDGIASRHPDGATDPAGPKPWHR